MSTVSVSIVQRGATSFRVRTRWKDPETGFWQEVNETVRGDKRVAEARKHAILTNFKTGKVERLIPDSVAKYLSEWLARRSAFGSIRPTTVATYDSMFKHFTAEFGERPLVSLRREQCREWLRRMVVAHGVNKARYTMTIVKTALSDAVKEGLLDSNPLTNLDKLPGGKKKSKTFAADKVRDLWNASFQYGDEGLILRTLLDTGARRGEVAALRWSDVSPSGVVRFARTAVHLGKQPVTIQPSKTEASVRQVTVSASLRDELNAKRGAPDVYVFSGTDEPPSPRRISQIVQRLLSHEGVEDFTAHDLRHAHATHLIRNKLPIPAISRRLGHSRVSITLDVYSHAVEEDEGQIVQALDSLLRGPARADGPDRTL